MLQNSMILILTIIFLSTLPTTTAQAAEHCADKFHVNVTLPNQSKWDLCWEPRRREGITLHHVYYTPRDNGQRRMILYQAALAQVHVPYDDNGIRFHDITDYGFGGYYQQDIKQSECKQGKLLKTDGKNMICQFTKVTGNSYHSNSKQEKTHSLTLFSISKVSDYTYIPYWEFTDGGQINVSIEATGTLQRLGNADSEKHGWLLSENKVGLSHLHNFYWRLDFDLNNTPKDDYVEEINFNKKNKAMEKTTRRLQKEAARSVNPATLRTWVINDANLKNTNGTYKGYEIQLNQSNHRDTGPATEGFTHNDFYVTQSKNCEVFASHNGIVGGCADDLAKFVNNQTLVNQDIVIWTSVSFYHVPRSEDIPNMDTHRSGFSIVPINWHDAK